MNQSLRTIANILAILTGAPIFSLQAQAMIINPIFADTYTGSDYGFPIVSLNGNPAAMAAIVASDSLIASQYGDNVTVNILYYGAYASSAGFLGSSITGRAMYSYTQFADALAADSLANPNNKVLTTAVANLGLGNGSLGDPGSTYVLTTTPDARALNLNVGIGGDASPEFDNTGTYLGANGTVDGIILLNLDQPFTYARPVPSVADAGFVWDAQTIMEHETDEVLGIGGPGSTLNYFTYDANFAEDFFGVSGDIFGPLDLYRYSAPGVASYLANPNNDYPPLTDPSEYAYFSVDGGNSVVDAFNQTQIIWGDAGDWGLASICPGAGYVGGSGGVQDAFACNNHQADVIGGSPEDIALQAIGYDRVPEPVTATLFCAGLAGAVAIRRRKTLTA